MFELKVLLFTDLEGSQQDHQSISGGKATHSLIDHEAKTFNTLKDLNEYIMRRYISIEYDEHNESYISHISEDYWDEIGCPEHFILNINGITKRPIGPEEL